MKNVQECIRMFVVMKCMWGVKLPSLDNPEKIFSSIKNYLIQEEKKEMMYIVEYVTALVLLLKQTKYEKRLHVSIEGINAPIYSTRSFDEDEAWILLWAIESYLE